MPSQSSPLQPSLIAARQAPRPLRILVAAYLFIGLGFASLIPLWEAPDAIWHYHFVAHLASGKGLPSRADEGLDAPWRQQGSQPPLYYLVTAPLVAIVDTSDAAQVIRENPHHAVGRSDAGGNLNYMVHGSWGRFPWQGTVLAARLVSLAGLIFGLVGVLATWAGLGRLLPHRPKARLIATGLYAFNPQFLFMSGAISNDIAAACMGALVFWRAACMLGDGGAARDGEKRTRVSETGDGARSISEPAPQDVESPRGAMSKPSKPSLTRNAAWLGLACGLAMITKLNGLWLLPPAALAIFLGAAGSLRGESSTDTPSLRPFVALLRILWRPLAAWAGAMALVAGWWYLRNLILFGDPTGLPLMFGVMSRRSFTPGPRELGMQLWAVWRSYWGVFGWFNLPAPGWFHLAMSLLTLTGLAGVSLGLARGRFERRERLGLLLAAAFVVTMLAGVIAWAQLQYPQGRLALPAAPALALLIGAGLGQVLGLRTRRTDPGPDPDPVGGFRRLAARGLRAAWPDGWLALAMALLSVYLLFGTILPAYRPGSLRYTLGDYELGLARRFGPKMEMELRSSMVDPPARLGRTEKEAILLHPGGSLAIPLTWEMRGTEADYSIFIHLLDEAGSIIAQRDSYPDSGRLATSDWHLRFAPTWIERPLGLGYSRNGPSDSIVDDHRLTLPPTHATTCDCRLIMGVYDSRTGQRLPVWPAGVPSSPGPDPRDLPDHLDLGPVRVEPALGPDGIPNPLSVPFGEAIELRGFALDKRFAPAGAPLAVDLYWQTRRPLREDYKISLQLRDAAGQRAAQRDERPADGARDTYTWSPKETLADHHPLELAADAAPGDYRLYLALYDAESGERLPVNWRDFELDLGPFKLVAP